MRYILATTLLMTVGMTSSASAGCGPAIQNWQNGSKMTCTYDSNGGGIATVVAAPAAVPSAPPPQPTEEKCYKDGDDVDHSGDRTSRRRNGDDDKQRGESGRRNRNGEGRTRGRGGNNT